MRRLRLLKRTHSDRTRAAAVSPVMSPPNDGCSRLTGLWGAAAPWVVLCVALWGAAGCGQRAPEALQGAPGEPGRAAAEPRHEGDERGAGRASARATFGTVGQAQEAGDAALLPEMTLAEDLDPSDEVVRVRLEAGLLERPGAFFAAYNGLNPGPVIRARRGQVLEVELLNGLDNPTTIHWHGSGAPFEMDGVAWMGAPVAPGERFVYRFTLNRVGTFWYHPHFDTERQVDGGLYGLLIVEDPEEPQVDEEIWLVLDTESEYDAEQDALPVGDVRRHAHGHGRLRERWLINGAPAPATVRVRGGQRVRVRILNASSTSYLDLRGEQLRQIASDQGLLPAPVAQERLVLSHGDRAELEWSVGQEGWTVSTAPYSLNGGSALGERAPLLNVVVDEPAPAPAPVEWPTSPSAPSPDPGYADISYAFAGSDRTGLWLINGERFPEVTIEEVALGTEPIIEVRNLSPTEHSFHLHGVLFEVLSVNDEPPATRTIEDTFNLAIRDRVRMRVLADNPGDWMLHCHILPHAADGMMTILRVREPTP